MDWLFGFICGLLMPRQEKVISPSLKATVQLHENDKAVYDGAFLRPYTKKELKELAELTPYQKMVKEYGRKEADRRIKEL
jgi:hypothetical protein